jgi:hypothetical protein
VVDLMPPEHLCKYTRMSPLALFYDEPGRYKHKILFIEEAVGAKDADLPVRSMQSQSAMGTTWSRCRAYACKARVVVR